MEIGNWMRNKENREVVKIKAIGVMVEYDNDNGATGFMQAEKVLEHFDLLNDPTERNDIECLLKAKIEADEAETGLYDCGLSYVVVDRVDGEVTFQWFDHAKPFSDVLLND